MSCAFVSQLVTVLCKVRLLLLTFDVCVDFFHPDSWMIDGPTFKLKLTELIRNEQIKSRRREDVAQTSSMRGCFYEVQSMLRAVLDYFLSVKYSPHHRICFNCMTSRHSSGRLWRSVEYWASWPLAHVRLCWPCIPCLVTPNSNPHPAPTPTQMDSVIGIHHGFVARRSNFVSSTLSADHWYCNCMHFFTKGIVFIIPVRGFKVLIYLSIYTYLRLYYTP